MPQGEVPPSAAKPHIIAGMPMYNEEETIGSVVTRALRYVDEVICIDDGSSDASARIAEACGATVIRHRVNRGYGGALKTLFLRAAELEADALVLLDSDGQHETSDIPKLLAPILAGEADFAIGSRFVDGGGGTDAATGGGTVCDIGEGGAQASDSVVRVCENRPWGDVGTPRNAG